MATAEDATVWVELISVVNASTDNVCEKLCCELKLLDSGGVLRAVVDEKVEKLEDKMLVEEVMESVVEDVGNIIAGSVVKVATDSIVEAMDRGIGTKEVATIVESALADNPGFIEDDVVTDTASPKDVARVSDKCVAVEGAVGTGLEEPLSALMMSAAFARKLGSDSYTLEPCFHTFSATPYTTACKCAAGITGKIPASTTLKFCVPTQTWSQSWLVKAGTKILGWLRRGGEGDALLPPRYSFRSISENIRKRSLCNVPQTRRCESTTPPCSSGSIANVPLGWNSVRIPLLII